MHISWDSLSIEDWYRTYNHIPKTNIVQSYGYAAAVRTLHQQTTRFGVIRARDNSVLGLVQMQEIRLFGLFHRVFIDRGPLWCDPAPLPETRISFWTEIAQSFPARFGRKRRFIPETALDPDFTAAFKRLGFKKAGSGYKTIWLDLRSDLDVIRSGFQSTWRNKLRRGEETDLMVECDDKGMMLDLLLAAYSHDKANKKYPGTTPEFIRAMETIRTKDEYSLILTACKDNGPPVAMMYFRIHGRSATYQIGWSNEEGRANRAHNLLLWHAIVMLKSRGIDWLDLGGINPEQAEGVTRFKKGIGGDVFETLGIYS